MRKVKNVRKLFLTLTLSVAMLVTEMPMTAFAVSTETVSVGEKEETEEQTQTEVIPEEGLPEDETEETTEEVTKEDEESSKDEASDEESKDEESSEESSEEGSEESSEESSEEAIAEQDEAGEFYEAVLLSSDSDFVINDGVLTGYNGTAEDVVIPDGVVTIKASVFKDNTIIKTVSFPSSVKTIENYAFSGCSSLGLVNLNEGLETIGIKAFSGAGLGETSDTGKIGPGTLTIPSTVRSIELGAFYNCAHLGEVIFADGDTAVLEIGSGWPNGGAFSSCPNLKKVTLPSRLKKVSTEAFRDNLQLSEVIMGDHVETIGESAFSGCSSLTGISFPSSLKTIENNAFYGCSSLGLVNLNEGLETIGIKAFSGTALGETSDTGKVEPGTLTIPSTVRSIELGAFYNCAHLGEVIFADGDTAVLEIGSGWPNGGAFSSCPNLKKVTLPSRLKKVSTEAFRDNPQLSEVIMGDHVETIGESAFSGCSSLKGISVPASLRTIENYAFSGCSSLGLVNLNEGLETIGVKAFSGVPLGVTSDTGKIEPGTLTIPSTVRSIELGAFYNCAYLGEVIFADGDTAVLE
ncbi:MAG: leucine-rich repeat domain-containing protein, partial [Acetatifactor sp.]|nr:leucine-rich repeat domain-containing protein [Acetatifactor sp.]